MELSPIREWHNVDREIFFTQIVPGSQPAVLRGLVQHWPIVQVARESPDSVFCYLQDSSIAGNVESLAISPADPSVPRSRFISYTPDVNGYNFVRATAPISQVIEQLRQYASVANPPSVAVQALPVSKYFPAFLQENLLPLLEPSITPRIWFGNMITVPAHFDQSNNIACVVAGSRRFILLPPAQIANMYIGPLDFSPTGVPMSMICFSEPDFERFPKTRLALSAAQASILEPGDAIYIPPLWWHEVQSMRSCNVLMNYWWYQHAKPEEKERSVLDCLNLTLLTLKNLPPEQKHAWRAIFDYYVFDTSIDPVEHIPKHRHGICGDLSAADDQQFRAKLARRIV